ncbi:MAG: type I-F CRISPR-associated endoribonuclease Cas6/Csy4 [Methylobacter sp.]|uniref:type I-F CRISPR-associated endoribonuclease Cas6/Csy4 n=1 Tax=Methylobacter sp. TaxID=2051955 RepID=UPI0027300C1B|nr:type I-F CRISPR-associated endoribonuclease Cas6/Csy4 [Methylobacter sp.]MDP1664896.1 type I-F CRISPR-associated endoribonuclease Cas6/Csy4 [Methylobacter sp.]
MKHYIEITLLPSSDINLFSLWSKVFQQIHLGLVEMQDDQGRVPIGLSFPEYVIGEKYSLLGDKLRLLADEATLSQFNATKWLSRLSDYMHCTSIRSVPEKITGYAIYQREQPKTNKERLARRYAKRHNIDYDTALLCYGEMADKTIATPFIRLKSLSGGNEFCLWIKKTVVTEPSGSTFSSYGLSAVSTVPDF